MSREFRRLLAAVTIALPMALVASPDAARAGISTELKTSGRVADVYESQTQQIFLNVMAVTRGGSGGGSSSDSDDGIARPPGKRGPRHPGEPVMLFGQDEYSQIQSGLITEEEAISGCGGAQVAGGNAGWGALALVGLFLALRRRK